MVKKGLKYLLISLGLSYICLMLGNGILNLTNPDEVFYVQTAKEMAQHHTWMTPYLFGHPQFEKPILLYWFLRLGLMISPNANFTTRFFPALFAGIGVIAVYFLSLIGFRNERKAFISALILMTGGLYIGLARTVFTDMIFSILILFSLLSFYWGYAHRQKKGLGIILFFISSAFAVLAKGPLGFLIPFLIILVFLLIKRELKFLFCASFLWGIVFFIAISFPWYLLMIKKYGSSFTYEFFYNVHFRRIIEAEHPGSDTWYFYPASMLGCFFPWSLYTLVSLVFLFKGLKRGANDIYIFLASWICATLFMLQPAHSKLTSYIFSLFPALALVTGDFVYNSALNENKNRLFFIISIINGVFLGLMATAFFFLIPRFSSYLSSKAPAYILSFVLLFFSGLFLFFVLRYKFFRAVYTLVVLMCLFSVGLLFVIKEAEPQLSSKEAAEYFLKNCNLKAPLIVSKPFVRGIRYYTDKDIIALDLPRRNFFSPHPVLFLGTDTEVMDYLRKQSVVYGIFKKANVTDMERIEYLMNKEIRFTILKKIGNEYILKIEHR